jgi:hypothetical protein
MMGIISCEEFLGLVRIWRVISMSRGVYYERQKRREVGMGDRRDKG